jgi:hypothetical protein
MYNIHAARFGLFWCGLPLAGAGTLAAAYLMLLMVCAISLCGIRPRSMAQ